MMKYLIVFLFCIPIFVRAAPIGECAPGYDGIFLMDDESAQVYYVCENGIPSRRTCGYSQAGPWSFDLDAGECVGVASHSHYVNTGGCPYGHAAIITDTPLGAPGNVKLLWMVNNGESMGSLWGMGADAFVLRKVDYGCVYNEFVFCANGFYNAGGSAVSGKADCAPCPDGFEIRDEMRVEYLAYISDPKINRHGVLISIASCYSPMSGTDNSGTYEYADKCYYQYE